MEQSNNKIFKNIILFPRTTELKEVVVKVKKPIFIKNDTVVYQPQKFKDGTERVVEDLLRNLPGIEVENDGQITYKGRKISKLLLEGDDLFGSNYTVGSRNIDVEMIEEVEAIENYIDNPLLKGIKSSEEVAINLKLIKGKTDFSGNADISYGHKKRHALKATLLSVSKNNKGFSTIQSNNVGQNYSPFDFSSNNLSIESRNNGELISSKIIRDEFFRKYEDDSRSSINNSFYSSFNYLFKVSHQFNLKFNLGYFKDELLQKLNRVNEYKFDSIRFNNTQSNYLTKKPNLYNNSLNFIYKFSKRSSLEYDGILNFNNISTSNNAFNNLIETNTALETKDFFLKQSLFFTTRINNNNVITAHGLYSYSESPQNYSINPGIDFQTQLINTELKDIQYSRFNKKHFGVNIDWLNSNGLGKFELSTGVSIIENKLKSFILEKENNFDYILLNDSLNNNFKYNLFKTYFKGAFNYKIDKWTIRPSIMINNFYGSFKNNIPYDFNVKTITKKFYFKPSLRIAYKTGDFSVLFASYRKIACFISNT